MRIVLGTLSKLNSVPKRLLKKQIKVKRLLIVNLAFLLITLGFLLYYKSGDFWISEARAADEDVATPTMSSCRDWIQSIHTLDYKNHGCKAYTDKLRYGEKHGGGVIPIGEDRFFIVWFPDNWDDFSNKKIVVTLHGSGGCAESLFHQWVVLSAQRKYAVVALQYAETSAWGNKKFDDSPQIYENLRVMLGELRAHCPIDEVPVVLHGFSRGSARTFELAVFDRADNGMRAFSAFISDSGTPFPETHGKIPSSLQNIANNGYHGAHFWLYCGGRDHDGQTCNGMKKMSQFILAHGATMDKFYQNPVGGHGILNTGIPRNQGQSLTALFDYIDTK
jgi:hypothetical protein